MSLDPRLNWLLTEPRTPPVTPNAKDEEWNDATGMSGTVNGLASSWTTYGGTRFMAYNNGRLVLTGTHVAASATAIGIAKTQPSTPYTVTCEVALDRHLSYNLAQIGFSDGTKFWLLGIQQDVVANTDEYRRTPVYVGRYATIGTKTSVAGGGVDCTRSVWLRVTNDGSNCIAYWSVTGVEGTYEVALSENYATALLTPTQFCVGVDPNSATEDAVADFGPVRVT